MKKNIPFSNICWLTATLSITACDTGERVQRIQQPNIILIFTDQQNADQMSIAGNPYLSTPNMDNLARRGIRFTQAYCTSPVCSPSRASIVTGLMPGETGVNYNQDTLTNVLTSGDLLRDIGYQTVWAGKWHLPAPYPQRPGTSPERKEIQGFEMLPFQSETNWWGLGADTDPPLTVATIDYLRDYDKSKPLFLAVSYHNPHDICYEPLKLGWKSEHDSLLELIRYGGGEKRYLPYPIGIHPDKLCNLPSLPQNFEIDPDEPEFISDKRTTHLEYGLQTKIVQGYSEKEWQAYLKAYNRMTELVDVEIGILLDALKEYGYNENTIIIFTSDHGDGAAAHRWASKLSLYEESVNVPFIMVYPDNIETNQVDDTNLVSLADIVPTILDYTGINADINFAGKSIRPLLENKKSILRDFVVTELADYRPDKTRRGRMLRTAGFKYNYYSSGRNNEQLFDLKSDPGETKNLAYDPRFKEEKLYHRQLLKDWMQERGDNFQLK